MSKKGKISQKEYTRMPLTSADVNGERRERLRKMFPEAVSDGKIDLARLGEVLGEAVDEGRERYGLSWAGKGDAIRAIQVPSVGTLIPCPDESVDFDTTENLFIEGDNLEVLKLLQKSYHGKVKMIYIDPPYNTGNEFIYPDNFRDGLQEYLRFTGQVDDEGVKLSTNRETSGRYHSNWLSMMYPRLFLARNLLRDDGAIFISIDDHEVHNLRLLMDEIFGEENFSANIVWQKKYAVSNDDPGIAPMHDHILVYQKTDAFERNLLPRTEKQLQRYKNLDNDPRGPWSSGEYASGKSRDERPTLWYSIKHPKTNEDVWPDKNAVWRYSKEKHQQLEAENRFYWGPDQSYEKPRIKRFLSEIQDGVVPSTWWTFIDVGHNDEGQKETAALLGRKVFSTPKPVRLLKRIIEISTDKEDLVLDFFAGSGTLGQAIFEFNLKDQGERKFILVQLPELTNQEEYTSIAEIGKERIRRVIKKLKEEDEGQLDLKDQEKPEDLGFKVFKLSSSNFKIWDAGETSKDDKGLAEQLELYADHVLPDRSDRDILFELLLKAGRSLTAQIEEKKVGGKTVYSIEDGTLLICLEERVTAKALRGMVGLKPRQVICLDNAFGGNDQLKTNTVLEMRDHEIEFRTV